MTKHKTAHPRGATRRASGGAATTSTTSAEVLMKQPDRTPFPKIVSQAQWQAAHERLLAKEKAATRARDKLAAERRRQPMTRIEKDYVFTGPKGPARLRDLFEGRRQLVLYHFMFAPGVSGWPQAGCDGCSMFVDQIGHPAPLANIEAYRKRMGWTLPWYSSADNDFNVDFGRTTPEGVRPQRLPARRRRCVSHLLHRGAWRRSARQRLDVPRSHPVWPPGRVGRLSSRLAPNATVHVVAQT